MTTKQFLDSVESDMEEGLDIVKAKNKDYADSTDPFKNFRVSGIIGIGPEKAILSRALEKFIRISNLTEKKNDVKDETIHDTIVDCCNLLYILNAYLKSNTK